MSNAGFRIFVDLSNFYSDYRSRARIFVDDNIQTMWQLQDKIKELFGIKDFVFVCNNEYLPFTEKIEILEPEETIWAIPSNSLHEENSKIKKSKLKRKVSTTEDITSPHHSEKKRKKVKLAAENQMVTDESKENNVNESVDPQNLPCNSDKLKKKKNKKVKTPEDFNTEPEQASLPSTSRLEQDSPKKPEYVCKGNLASYKKKIPVPMITDEYLKKKKINIIKIEVLHNGLGPVEQGNTSQDKGSYNLPSPFFVPYKKKYCNRRDVHDLHEHYSRIPLLNKAEEVVPQQYMQAEVPYAENSQRTGAEDFPEVVADEIPLNGDTKDCSQNSLPKNRNTESLMNGDQEMIETETKSDNWNLDLNNHEDIISATPDNVVLVINSSDLDPSKYQSVDIGPVTEQSGPSSVTDYQVPKERKRKRVRKRKNKQVDLNDTPVPLPQPEPMRVKGRPSMHIKFKDEENGNLGDEELDETESVTTVNDKEYCEINEEVVMKSPLMRDLKPQVGNIIAFKIVRITESYTPELSSYMVGLVEEIENDELLLNVTSGLDQCMLPKGKLTIENEAEEVTTLQRFHWNSLLETRLVIT